MYVCLFFVFFLLFTEKKRILKTKHITKNRSTTVKMMLIITKEHSYKSEKIK